MALSIGELTGYVDLDTSGVDKGVGKVGGILGRAKGTWTGILRGNARDMGKAIAVGIGAGVIAGGAITGALYAVGGQFDDMSDTIRVKTGATGKSLDRLVKSAERVGKQVPAEFGEIAPVLADLHQRLNLTGKPLQRLTKQFLEAGRITGQAINVQTFTKAFSVFDVQGAQTSKTMDKLYQVSQATGVGMNELAASVAQNGPNLKQFGFSIGDSAALIGTLDKAGLDSNKTLATLSHAMVEFAKDGKEPQAALRGTIDQISDFVAKGKDAEAIDMAGKVFGTRGASQFVAAIKSGKVQLDDLMKATGKTGDTILKAGDDTADFAEHWQVFKNKTLVALEPVATRVFGAIGDLMGEISQINLGSIAAKVKKAFANIGLDKLRTKVQNAIGKIDIGSLGTTLAKQASEWAAPIIEGVKTGLDTGDWSGLGEAVGNGLLQAIQGAGALVVKIGTALGDLLGGVDWVGIGMAMGEQAPSLLAGLAVGLLNFDIMGLLSGLAAHWQEVLLAVIAVAFAPAKVIGKVAEVLAKIPFVGKLLAWGLLAFKRFSDKLMDLAGKALSSLGKAFMDGFRKVFPNVGKGFADALRVLPTRLGVVAINVAERAKAMVSGIGGAIGRGIGSVVSKIGELIARMLKPFADAASWLIGKGAAIVKGLLGGLRNAAGTVWSWFRGLGGKALDAVGDLGSLLRGIGQKIIQGLLDGITDKFDDLKSLLGKVTSLIPKWKGPPATDKTLLTSAGHMIMDGLIGGLLDGMDGMTSALEQITENIRTLFSDDAEHTAKAIESHYDKALAARQKAIESRYDKLERALKSKLKGSALSKAMGKLDKSKGKALNAAEDANDKARQNKLQEAAKAERKNRQAILAIVKAQTPALKANAAAQAAVNEQLSIAVDDLATAQQQYDDFAGSVRDMFRSFGDVTKYLDDSGATSADAIIAGLQGDVAKADAFQDAMNKLILMGLNDTALQQIKDKGIEAGLATAQAIVAGGPNAIGQINTLSAQLDAAGAALGTSLSDQLYGSGLAAAQALVVSLQSQSDALAAVGVSLAQAFVEALNAELAKQTGPTFEVIRDALPKGGKGGKGHGGNGGGNGGGGNGGNHDGNRDAPLIGYVVQRDGESTDELAERLWFKTRTRG